MNRIELVFVQSFLDVLPPNAFALILVLRQGFAILLFSNVQFLLVAPLRVTWPPLNNLFVSMLHYLRLALGDSNLQSVSFVCCPIADVVVQPLSLHVTFDRTLHVLIHHLRFQMLPLVGGKAQPPLDYRDFCPDGM